MNITMLGAGLIGRNYTTALHAGRSRDRVTAVYSRTDAAVQSFAQEFGIPHATTDMHAAIMDPSTGLVVIGLPNHLHEEAVMAAVKAGKGVLCTKPLGRTAAEAYRMLQAVEEAGVFHGYLEDLTYTPKTLKALESVRAGAIGTVLWARAARSTPGRIERGSGTKPNLAAVPSSIWVVTASKSHAISSAKTSVPSK